MFESLQLRSSIISGTRKIRQVLNAIKYSPTPEIYFWHTAVWGIVSAPAQA